MKKPPPSALKLALDQRVIPAAIDIAGALEGLLERVAVRARKQPAAALGAALATALLLGVFTRRQLQARYF